MDGFSRRMMWVTVGNTNSDPQTMVQSYLEYIDSIDGVPIKLRVDRGIENVTALDYQALLRLEHDDESAAKPYIIGRSVERWWAFLKQNFGQFWINLFKDMIEIQVYNPHDYFEYSLLQFCFTESSSERN